MRSPGAQRPARSPCLTLFSVLFISPRHSPFCIPRRLASENIWCCKYLSCLVHLPRYASCILRQARDLVKRSSGVERTRELALAYARAARDALQPLPESEAKQALEALTERVVKRTH